MKTGAAQMLEADARAALSFGPPRTWINYTAFEKSSTAKPHGIYYGAFSWLFEEQIRIEPAGINWYYRTVDEVIKPQALDDLSSIGIDFDPAYERLHFHHARIIRGQTVIEIPIDDRYMLLRREKNFESSMLDGQWTLGATLPDVRIGDLIDIAFTVSGMPAIFEDRFGPALWMQGNGYHEARRIRIVNASARPLVYRPFLMGCVEPKLKRLDDGAEEFVFEDFAVEPYHYEPNAPDWLRMWRGFYISNVAQWSEIAELERHGYEGDHDGPLVYPAGLLAVIANIETRFPKDEERIVETLRYVQEHIRYFSVSMGAGGYIPRSLDEIFHNRMGDCKDVSKLTVAMLAKMNIEAYPVLVDTRYGLDLVNSIPRIWAFDHAIAMVVHKGRNYFLDATSFTQYGTLDVIDQADFGYALPLKANASLTPMASGLLAGNDQGADAPPLIYEVIETIHLPKGKNKTTRLDIDYVFNRVTADYMRYSLSHKRLDNFAKDTCELYAHIYGYSTVCALPQIMDDKVNNQLIIRQSLETENPWIDTAKEFTKLFISAESAFGRVLDNFDSRQRFFPYDLGAVRRVRQITRLKTDMKLKLPTGTRQWNFGPLHLSATGQWTGDVYESIREYSIKKTYLLPRDKWALDLAQADIESYDRISIIYEDQKQFSWLRGLVLRGLVIGLPVLGLLAWLVFGRH